MRPPRSTVRTRFIAVLGGLAVLLLGGCTGDQPGNAGPKAGGPEPADADVGGDAPVRLAYLCGNRFLITNAYSVPVTVTYRVGGDEEAGSVTVPAAPAIDPAFSEAMIETRGRGTVQLFLEGRPVIARANGSVPCTPDTPAPAFLTVGSATGGEWSAPFDWPVVAVHLSLLPDGRVLSYGRNGVPEVWNPATGAFTVIPSPVNLFCSGHTLLSDGRLFVAGGHITDDHGLPNITLFSGQPGQWTSGTPMARGRWYPTTTVMGNGSVVITAGRDQAGTAVTSPEIWTDGALKRLTPGSYQLPYYPRAFAAPNGQLFVAGEYQASRYLSLSGSGTWRTAATRLYGTRDYGSAVMYDDGKILYVGGGRTTNTAETIDLNQSTPRWSWTGSMAYRRRHLNATVLPTGEVLVTGGLSGTAFNDVSTGVHPAELWSPATGQWTTLASNSVTRGYHATSLLLPDGRVLHAGSGDGGGAPRVLSAELFSPPYLFRGLRPVITGAPASVRYGEVFRVDTPDAPAITAVSLIRLGSVTHAFDMSQRFQRVGFTADAAGLTVTAPSVPNRTPPGYYMLFLVTGAGVPSVARIVRIH
jgi:Galactose oxidase-like, Early set domain